MYCEITHFSVLVCPDIVTPNFDVFQGNSEPSRLRCSISFFLTFSLVFSFFLRHKWIPKISAVSRVHRYPEIRDPTLKNAGIKSISAWGFL